ncbi:MAG: M23 family metallopeptidase [Acaryochloris sp. CRU_2_0]|nr:M23 family metallopeptidase [Acaryochloris sp. CRU_2_0]
MITVSALGGLITEQSAAAAISPAQLQSSPSKILQLPDLIGSSRYQTSQYPTQGILRATVIQDQSDRTSVPLVIASTSTPTQAAPLLPLQQPSNVLAVSEASIISPAQSQEPAPESARASFTQGNLIETSQLLADQTIVSLNPNDLLVPSELLSLSKGEDILALDTSDVLDPLTQNAVKPNLLAESSQLLNSVPISNPLDLSTTLEQQPPIIDTLATQKVSLEAPTASALESQEPVAVLPDVDLTQTIIPNDQNSALIDSGAIIHQVKPGETLEDISRLYQVSAKEITKANRISDLKTIEPKTQLRIPAHQSLSLSLNTAQDIANPKAKTLKSNPEQPLTGRDSKETVANSTVPKESGDVANDLVEPTVAILPIQSQLTAPEAGLNGRDPAFVATRSILPQVPSLELPPLSSVDEYLPSQMLSGPQKYIWPAKGILTSPFGWRWGRPHRGIDIASAIGTPVVAAAPGIVTTAGWNSGGYGNLVEIRHPDGSLTVYAHNNTIRTRVGQSVDQGEQIAEMGSTGRSTGPHTHFELHPTGKGAVNPMPFFRQI